MLQLCSSCSLSNVNQTQSKVRFLDRNMCLAIPNHCDAVVEIGEHTACRNSGLCMWPSHDGNICWHCSHTNKIGQQESKFLQLQAILAV